MTLVEFPQSVCQFGIATGDITPPVGIYHRMWGAAKHDRSTGVHRPLTASAVLFREIDAESSPDSQQLMIALDHCLLEQSEIDRIVAAIEQQAGIPPESIVVLFSHTHAAGLLIRDRSELPGGDLIPDYLASVAKTVAQLAARAVDELQDVTISYANGHCDLAAHRDLYDEVSQQWVCGYNPSGIADDLVLVARVTNSSGAIVATVVNYACHPTTLAWDNQLISPDYPGAMRELIERATDAPCVFIQGASGDIGPRHGFVGDIGIADQNGRQLGYAALSSLEGLPAARTRFEYSGPVVSGATIGPWHASPLPDERQADCAQWSTDRQEVPLSYRPELPTLEDARRQQAELRLREQAARDAGDDQQAADLRALVERKSRLITRLICLPIDRYPFRTVVWRVGDAVWVAVQGEPYQILQRELRRRFLGVPVIVAVLADGWGASYLPPAELYGQGIYQETVAVVSAGSLEHLIDNLTARITACLPNNTAG
ncbi:MAG: hypothetical protein QGG71_12235 [Pirellulaceae bacterium]|nr:hypothetical protein [Pirellulaceae bacterium]